LLDVAPFYLKDKATVAAGSQDQIPTPTLDKEKYSVFLEIGYILYHL